jgi:hypothetical protein
MGLPLKSLQGFGVPAESYGFANNLLACETVAPLRDRAWSLRTAHLRGPFLLEIAPRSQPLHEITKPNSPTSWP